MDKNILDRNVSLPLYRQIAARLQFEIATGMREPGERLPSLREAAGEWGVNLHTVRRAYKELEAASLVETSRPGGTRVADLRVEPTRPSLEEFLNEITDDARRRFGIDRSELAALLGSQNEKARTPQTGFVLECSRTLSEMLAGRLEERLGAALEPLDLRQVGSVAGGALFGTWFHRAELLQRFPGRERDLHLIRIRPANALFDELRRMRADGQLWSIMLVDRHAASGHDLTVEFHSRIESGVPVEFRVPSNPVAGFPAPEGGTIVVATPQTWDELPQEVRQREDVRLLRYEIDPTDLERLAQLDLRRPAIDLASR